tara:strand:+ start:1030 stop:1551 length:522 start_codon:yes stop_codon:yes gene_type:complete
MATNLEFIKSASGSSVSLLDVTDCFSADFDVYYFAVTKMKRASASNFIYIRFLDSGGTVIDQAEYDYAAQEIRPYTTFLEVRATGQTLISQIAYGSSNTEDMGGISMYVYNPYDSSSYTFTQSQSSSFVNANGGWGNKTIGVHKNAEQISGVRFVAAGSVNLDTIEVSVFGVK